jgi:hypothetical protein
MDLVNILIALRRRRGLVIASAVIAIALGVAVTLRVFPPAPESSKKVQGSAVARVLLDTPATVITHINPRGSEFLGPRANLLANVMVEGPVKASIARRAKVPLKQLYAYAESSATADADAPIPDDRPYVLLTRVLNDDAGGQLPIIEIETEAPGAKPAAGLANAAVTGLKSYLDAKAATESVPPERRLLVRPLGPAQASEVVLGKNLMAGLAAAIFTFLALCAAILGISALSSGLRRAAVGEPSGLGTAPPLEPRLEPVPGPSVRELPPPDAEADLRLLRGDMAS